MPSPRANQLARLHQAELAVAGTLVAQRTRQLAQQADPAAVDSWWAQARPELLALVAAGFAGTVALGARFLGRLAGLEGRTVEPVRARWSTARAEASLHATGPAEFKTHVAAGGSPVEARAAMATTMSGAAQRLALAGERDTVAATVRDSDVIVGWRRQVDADPCAWCAMLASRGAVYKSAATAAGFPYHDHDQCIAVPLFEREQEPPEVELLYERWLQVTAGHSGRSAIREWRRWWDEHRGQVDLNGARQERTSDRSQAQERDRQQEREREAQRRREQEADAERDRRDRERREAAERARRRNPQVVTGSDPQWWEQIREDTDEPIPVRDLRVSGGDFPYSVANGRAVRRNGVAYLIEDGSEPDWRRVVNELEEIHATLPGGSQHQHAYVWLAGRNPADAYWERQYNRPGFRSLATAGDGSVRVWGQTDASVSPRRHRESLQHEFGHNLSSNAEARGLDARGRAWADAVTADDTPLDRVTGFITFNALDPRYSAKAGNINFGVRPDRPFPRGVTDYGASSVGEDYAEAVALYLHGPLGTANLAGRDGRVPVYFRDIFPARAAVLDQLFPDVAARQAAELARR